MREAQRRLYPSTFFRSDSSSGAPGKMVLKIRLKIFKILDRLKRRRGKGND